jgi:CHAT domain-containing protein
MNGLVRCFLAAALCAVGLGFQESDPFSKDRQQAAEYVNKGLLDRALVLLEDGAKRAESAGVKETAAQLLIQAADLYREENRRAPHLETLIRAGALASGTPLEPVATNYLALALIEGQIDAGNIETALEGLGEIFDDKVSEVRQPDARRALLAETLSLRQRIQIQVAGYIDDSASQSAARVQEPLRRVLEVLLSDDPGKRPRSVAGSVEWLDQQQPWGRRLFEVALHINEREAVIEGGFTDERAREMRLAQDASERGTILGDLNRIDEAIQLKRGALDVFHKYNIFRDSAVAASNLCGLLLKKGDSESLLSAFMASRLVMGLVESQTFVQVAQTVDPFLQEYRRDYERHAMLLWTRYLTQLATQNDQAADGLDEFLIHEDRFLFRSVRRDMAVYHDLGETIGRDSEMRARLDRSLGTALRAERSQDRTAREIAGRDFVTALEDIKRRETRTIGLDPTITAFMKNVRAGMAESDGVLMYFTAPGGQMHAALIGARDARIFPLAKADPERLRYLTARLNKQIVASPQGILDELSAALVAPLPPLARRLTIVLHPDLLGIPFEALKTADGKLLVDAHEVRYAFGLYRNVGMAGTAAPVRRAMVVGAEAFDGGIESLPQSRQEVEGVRALLTGLKVEVVPRESLPETGGALLSDPSVYQLIHISTHSRLDETTPILDSLLFPKDRIYAHHFALAPARASLVVLSACALYQRRADRLYPVSGVTTAALARIAPQVLSPLWEVNAAATRVFMLRFYSAYAGHGDAPAALARAKRDFASGDGLREWLKTSRIADVDEDDIAEYRRPYYWAPFVLTTGVQSQE